MFFKNKTFLISLLILAVGIVLRFWQLPPRFVFGGDQSYLTWEVWNLTQGHFPLVGFEAGGVGGVKLAPFLLYFLAGPFLIFSQNPLVIEVIFSLFGAIRGVLFYLIGRNVFGQRIGLLAAFIYLVSERANIIDRKFFGATFLILSSLLVFYFLAKIKREMNLNILNLILLGSIIGLSFSAHYQSVFLILASLFFLVIIKKNLYFKHLGIFIVSILVWLLTLALFELRHNFSILRRFLTLANETGGDSILTGFTGSAQYLVQLFFGLISAPIYKTSLVDILPQPLFWLLFLVILALPLLLIKIRNYSSTKPVLTYFAFIIILAFFALSFLQRPDYEIDPYYWFLIPAGIFIWALLINYLLENKATVVLGYVALGFFAIFNLYNFFTTIPVDTYQTKNQLVAAILNDMKTKNLKSTVIKFEDGEPPAFDYLFFYQMRKQKLDPSKLILISRHELFQERILLGGQPGPIRILPKSAGENLTLDYIVTEVGKENPNLVTLTTVFPYSVQKKF